MSAIVILSSSPPRAFARSPTSGDPSSPLASPGTRLHGDAEGSRCFKPVSKTRDGFTAGFSSAPTLLTTKLGAENIPLQTPSNDRFKPTSPNLVCNGHEIPITGPKFTKKKVDPTVERRTEHSTTVPALRIPERSPKFPPRNGMLDFHDTAVLQKWPKGEEALDPKHSSPIQLDKALPRRVDWTPTNLVTNASYSTAEPEEELTGFSKDLLNSFAYTGSEKITTKAGANGEALRPRRIDLVMTTESFTEPLLPLAKEPEKDRCKRKRAPAKKSLTITGLATSTYANAQKEAPKFAPMLEYLTTTQASAESDVDMAVIKVGRTNARTEGPKRSRPSNKAPPKSRLEPPESGIKAVSEQDMLFGSVSQLARHESPNLTQDTIEVLKQSECSTPSDPISPQRTQTFTIASPKVCRGTSRFIKRRHLWSAAGRDEDNALLHIDTVDLVDSPAVRQALPGKDVLLQLGDPMRQCNGTVQKRAIDSPLHKTPLANNGGLLLDIDDLVTPGRSGPAKSPTKVQARSHHTSAGLKKSQTGVDSGNHFQTASETSVALPDAKSVPVKPSYSGFSTYDLQKQISAYGFKRVKKRETMIKLLEECWESQHVESAGEIREERVNTVTHGDILSKVHDVSERPAPKVKKIRAKRKSETCDSTVKEPKKRKKSDSKAKDTQGNQIKDPPKRATKIVSKDVVSEEIVLDIDDLDDLTGEKDPRGSVSAEVAPSHKKAKTTKRESNTVPRSKKLATPQPAQIQPSSPVFETFPAQMTIQHASGSEVSASTESGDGASLSPQTRETPPLADIQSQIHAAIHFCPRSNEKDTRNHQKSPTWREKILLYDPIALEELTVWLNTRGFRYVGEDREISPLEVRSWCEQNGVCCYGVGAGWRGRGRRGEAE